MLLSHNLFIQMFIPKRKPTTRLLLQVVGYQLWAQLGSNQRPPYYEEGIISKILIIRRFLFWSAMVERIADSGQFF
jgi:hypothetical protein